MSPHGVQGPSERLSASQDRLYQMEEVWKTSYDNFLRKCKKKIEVLLYKMFWYNDNN